MLKIGLSGGIGSGKTVAAEIFHIIGIPVFKADEVARKLYELDEVLLAVKEMFGSSVIGPGGKLERKAMAAIVFNNKEALYRLNDLIHPLVRNRFTDFESENHAVNYILYEAAILFETGQYRNLDRNILVIAPVELRLKRVMARDKSDRESVLRRMENQWDDEQKRILSDYIILNDGDMSLIDQVLKIHEDILSITK